MTRRGGTRKHKKSGALSFQQEITVFFLEKLLMIKLYHWKTTSYAEHKATDDLYAKLNSNIDTFIEILLGKTETRTSFPRNSSIPLMDVGGKEALRREIDLFKTYLIDLNDHPALKSMANTDLYNLRDTILGDLNQFLYLLTFQ